MPQPKTKKPLQKKEKASIRGIRNKPLVAIEDDNDELRALISEHIVKPMGAIRVKKLIKTSGLTQAEFAKALNVSAVTIFNWSSGEKEPRGSALLLLNLAARKGIQALLS